MGRTSVSRYSGITNAEGGSRFHQTELAGQVVAKLPGMFGNARFRSQASYSRMVVPATALLRLHDKDWVFKSEGGVRFRRTEVQAGPAGADGQQEILAGDLRAGDAIIANALQFSSATEQ